jgi:hypothetical protein
MPWSHHTEQEVVSEHIHRSQHVRGGLLPPCSAATVDQKDKFLHLSVRVSVSYLGILTRICIALFFGFDFLEGFLGIF